MTLKELEERICNADKDNYLSKYNVAVRKIEVRKDKDGSTSGFSVLFNFENSYPQISHLEIIAGDFIHALRSADIHLEEVDHPMFLRTDTARYIGSYTGARIFKVNERTDKYISISILKQQKIACNYSPSSLLNAYIERLKRVEEQKEKAL